MEANTNMAKFFLILLGLATAATAELALAQDSEVFFPEYFLEMTLPDWCFGLMLDDAPSAAPRGYAKFPFVAKLGIGLLNVPLGLGSYVAGEWRDGLTLTLLQGGGIALALGSYYYLMKGSKWSSNGFVAFCQIVGLATLVGTGASLYCSGVLNGLSFPFGFTLWPLGGKLHSSSNARKKKIKRSWDISLIPFPDANGNIAGHLAIKMSY